MTFENFFKILDCYKRGSEMISDLHDFGFDLMEGKFKLSDILYEQLQHSIRSVYGDEGLDWVEWFIFENKYGEGDFVMEAWHEDELICQTYEELYKYLEKHHKLCTH
jgi:hypothetical protein